jgi:DNA polymerase-3 subunit delta
MESLAFLGKVDAAKVLPLYVLHGDEEFLKRQVLEKLRQRVLGAEAEESALSVQAGDKASFAAVFDELETVGFFAPRRLVIVENADPFVSKHRAQLEKKLTALPASGTLVLDVKSWPANTRLAKMVDQNATIVCKAPPAYKLAPWCVEWAASQQQKQLTSQAATLLVDLVGPDMGLLNQEILKLAIYVGNRQRITGEDVDRLVGHSRAENIWKIFDAMAEGRSGEAMTILDRLFDQGEEPMRILGAFAMQLRRLAQAARLTTLGRSLTQALEEAGIPPFGLKNAEQQLRHLGRRRADKLYDWLLEINMGIRGNNPLPERTQLERLVAELATT